MLRTDITYCGRQTFSICDGKCNKAWGMQCRPEVFFDKNGEPLPGEPDNDGNWDDYAYLPDHLLGEAPEDPGTYEGFEGKPDMQEVNEDPTLRNRWCVRQCEREEMRGIDGKKEPKLRTFETFFFNIPSTEAKVAKAKSNPGWEEKLKTAVEAALKREEERAKRHEEFVRNFMEKHNQQ